MGEQSQLLLKPTEVELGLQVGVEFDKSVFHLKPFFLNFLSAVDFTMVGFYASRFDIARRRDCPYI